MAGAFPGICALLGGIQQRLQQLQGIGLQAFAGDGSNDPGGQLGLLLAERSDIGRKAQRLQYSGLGGISRLQVTLAGAEGSDLFRKLDKLGEGSAVGRA